MYDTDKYKNYMSIIPQSWLGKAKAMGLMGMGGGSAFGQLGNTDPRPTPDWLPRNFQSPNRKPTIENGEMTADWFGSPFTSRWNRRWMAEPDFENYGIDKETGEKYDYKGRPPMKFQSIGSDDKGRTKYEIRPYNDAVDLSLQNLNYGGTDGSYTYKDVLGQNPHTSIGLPGGVSWNYNPFQIYDRKTNRVDVQPWMEDRGQFETNFGYTSPTNDSGEPMGDAVMTDVLERMWNKLQKGNYKKAANLYNKVGDTPVGSSWFEGVAY